MRNYHAKVIFEFNDEEDRIEIENMMKRNDFKYALEKIKEYRRLLYKEYINNKIIVKDKKSSFRVKRDIKIRWKYYRKEILFTCK